MAHSGIFFHFSLFVRAFFQNATWEKMLFAACLRILQVLEELLLHTDAETQRQRQRQRQTQTQTHKPAEVTHAAKAVVLREVLPPLPHRQPAQRENICVYVLYIMLLYILYIKIVNTRTHPEGIHKNHK